MRTAVQSDEPLASHVEIDRHHRADFSRPGLAVVRNAGDLVVEYE
jgi:hypothetical protein